MFQPRSSAGDRDTRIAALSDDFLVRRVQDHWLIAGPTGVFVVGFSGSQDPRHVADEVVGLAQKLRTLLSAEMAWVPFVDALLVGNNDESRLPCSVVSPSMLESVLTDGHNRVEFHKLFEIRRLLPGLAQQLAFEPSACPHPAVTDRGLLGHR